MRNLLETVTTCIDSFSQEKGIPRFAAIIGGEAIILHGIPRTTLDLDILLFCEDAKTALITLSKHWHLFCGNLSRILTEGRRRRKTEGDDLLETLKGSGDPKPRTGILNI